MHSAFRIFAPSQQCYAERWFHFSPISRDKKTRLFPLDSAHLLSRHHHHHPHPARHVIRPNPSPLRFQTSKLIQHTSRTIPHPPPSTQKSNPPSLQPRSKKSRKTSSPLRTSSVLNFLLDPTSILTSSSSSTCQRSRPSRPTLLPPRWPENFSHLTTFTPISYDSRFRTRSCSIPIHPSELENEHSIGSKATGVGRESNKAEPKG